MRFHRLVFFLCAGLPFLVVAAAAADGSWLDHMAKTQRGTPLVDCEKGLLDPDTSVRQMALREVLMQNRQDLMPRVEKLLEDAAPGVRAGALNTLWMAGRFDRGDARERVGPFLKDADAGVRRTAFLVLSDRGAFDDWRELLPFFKETDGEILKIVGNHLVNFKEAVPEVADAVASYILGNTARSFQAARVVIRHQGYRHYGKALSIVWSPAQEIGIAASLRKAVVERDPAAGADWKSDGGKELVAGARKWWAVHMDDPCFTADPPPAQPGK